jgi:hypothetical protein
VRWWLLTAGAAGLVVVSVIALTGQRGSTHVPATPTAAPAPCPDLHTPSRQPTGSAALFVRGEVTQVSVDGHRWTPGVRVAAGRHALEVQVATRTLSLTVEFDPFTTTLLEVREDPAGLVPLLVGACASCQPPGDVDLGPLPGTAALDEAARALGAGAWRQALEQLRRVPANGRHEPRVATLLASTLGLAGEPERSPQLASMLRAAKDREGDERTVERAWALGWWNSVTNRFASLALALAGQAPRAVEATRARIERLSNEFAEASLAGDVARQEALAQAAEEVTKGLAVDLAALRPTDCAWRATVQAAVDAR